MVQFRDVGITYPNGVRALSAISLTVEEGAMLAVVGGSGCGKSTLLRLLAGLEQPTEGRLKFNGGTERVSGVVFQEPRLLPWLNVAQNVLLGLGPQPPPAWESLVGAALARVGLFDFARAWPKELSGGMAQRVALARALVRRPSLLLLDEPFAALDAVTRRHLQDQTLGIWERRGSALVIVTHDVEEAVLFADRVIVLNGRPGTIGADYSVDLPRPRDREATSFQAWKSAVLRAIGFPGAQ